MFRIFLTNLGKYNEGYLVGKWVDLPCDDLESELKEIGISDEPDEHGRYYEEWFITDYENDFGCKVDEYENLDNLNELAENLKSLNEDEMIAFRAYMENGEDPESAYEYVQSGDYRIYYGCNDMTDVAYHAVEDSGMLEGVPDNVVNYFDYEAYGRDLGLESTFTYVDGNYVELF